MINLDVKMSMTLRRDEIMKQKKRLIEGKEIIRGWKKGDFRES